MLGCGAALTSPAFFLAGCERAGGRLEEAYHREQEALRRGLIPTGRIHVRRSDERGFADRGWLKSRHTFSFSNYRDPRFMGFRALRVINEDHIAGGGGFPMHPHRDMEIVTYVLSGALEHKDSLGNGSVIRPREVQRMTAGSGIRHSEFNPSTNEQVHLLQIWIQPDRRDYSPSYEQRTMSAKRAATQGHGLELIAGPPGAGGTVTIQQDTMLFAGKLPEARGVAYDLQAGRHCWVQVARGAIQLNGHVLGPGDAAYGSDAGRLLLEPLAMSSADGDSAPEVLIFDLA